ncbi:MAG: helix-turn-helix transcriptional regulator, partial [Lachnospiraceae bacterium]|nr:helix-turn-helix transcriptional regulator [Lachnospiraceae bacterium]
MYKNFKQLQTGTKNNTKQIAEKGISPYNGYMELKERILKLRTEQGLSQRQLAEKMGTTRYRISDVYSDRLEHTARCFSALLPLIQCTLSGHQSIFITLECLNHYLLAMTQ